MVMDYSSFYGYKKSDKTHTIDEFISCQSDTSMCYNNLSFIDQYDGIKFNTYNVLSDYLDDIKDNYCKTIELNQDEAWKYKYRPKLLAYDIYGNTELAFTIQIKMQSHNIMKKINPCSYYATGTILFNT